MQAQIYAPDDGQKKVIDLFTKNQNPPSVVFTIAAPGTGKTTTITRLAQQIINSESLQQKYKQFLILTFTKRTKDDLIQKFKAVKGKQKQKLLSRIKNFHSLAKELVQWKDLIDDDAVEYQIQKFLQKYCSQHQIVYSDKQLKRKSKTTFDLFMAEGYTYEQWQNNTNWLKQKGGKHTIIGSIVFQVYLWIMNIYKNQGKTSFDASLLLARQRIKEGKNVYKLIFQQIDLLIVDQFQDTNCAQLKIIEQIMIRNSKMKLLFVGDFDQNIYNFRGAKLKHIQNFFQKYPPQKQFLKNSYRLNDYVKNASQNLIVCNQQYANMRQKFYQNYQLKACNKQYQNTRAQVNKFSSQISEVRWVVDKLYQLTQQKNIPYGEITILIRGFKNTTFYSRLKLQLQRRQKIGQKYLCYEVLIHQDILKSKTVKILLSYLTYFYKKKNRDNYENEVKTICSNIKFISFKDKNLNRFSTNGINSHNLITAGERQDKITSWNHFFIDFKKIEQMIINKDFSFRQICVQIGKILNEATWLKQKIRQNKIQQFLFQYEQVIDSVSNNQLQVQPILSVVKKLSNLSRTNKDQQKVKKRSKNIQIQTIHCAKGLQYRAVFLCGLNFQYIPDKTQQFDFSNFTNQQQKERALKQYKQQIIQKQNQELRLIYTALTRTSQYAFVTSSEKDNFRPYGLFGKPKQHPYFLFLKNDINCNSSQETIPRLQPIDSQVERYYKQNNKQAKKQKAAKERQQARQQTNTQRMSNRTLLQFLNHQVKQQQNIQNTEVKEQIKKKQQQNIEQQL